MVYAYVTTAPDVVFEETVDLSEPRQEVMLLVVGNEMEEKLEEIEIADDVIVVAEEPAPIVSKDAVPEEVKPAPASELSLNSVPTVPFYSQFTDISSTNWQKVGCGIASLAMLIDYYSDEPISVDSLLQKGISAGAYLNSAGWIHSGLIKLSAPYGLGGKSVSLSNTSMSVAFSELESELINGPVMVSVHYTFEPTNPIPHLVVVNGVSGGKVFYNDPAEAVGNGVISIDKFQRAWKKRYIKIRPI